VIVLVAIVLLGAVLGWVRVLAQDEKRLIQTVVATTQELTTQKELLRRTGDVREDLADLTKRIQSIQALMHRRGTTLHILDALLDSIPADVWITTLEGRGRELRAHGGAGSPAAVVHLMASLRASGKFHDVEIVVARQDLGEVLDAPLLFEITCRFGS
jgi:Tfp pilus assembly protein PilN